MSYIKDDARIRDIVIPGAHNSISHEMGPIAKCQQDGIYKQYESGVRFFCIRLTTDSFNVIRASHGLAKGKPFENHLRELARVIEETLTEFLILDIRPYYDKKIGPLNIKFKVNSIALDALLNKYLPVEYELVDSNLPNMTMREIRTSGKKFCIMRGLTQIKTDHNKDGDVTEYYRFNTSRGVDFDCTMLWNKRIYGYNAENFCENAPSLLESETPGGLVWFQTQQTPNLNTEIGISSPEKLDQQIRKNFYKMINKIQSDKRYLDKSNIICGDFMTVDMLKTASILNLNLSKNIVQQSLINEFKTNIQVALQTITK
jgi:hypothetical protein